MLGVLAMLFVFLTLISLISYWISWDMQHSEKRLSFAVKVRNDVMRLFGKSRSSVPNAGLRSFRERPVRVAPVAHRQAQHAPARSIGTAAK
jgi:hypothetical protein